MNGLIDTNLLVYAVQKESPHFEKVNRFLEELYQDSLRVHLAWPIYYEFLSITTNPRLFQKPLSWEKAYGFLEKFRTHPKTVFLKESMEHAKELKKVLAPLRKPQSRFLHDCHLATLAYENSVQTIYTHDEDFRRFPFVKVVDPILEKIS